MRTIKRIATRQIRGAGVPERYLLPVLVAAVSLQVAVLGMYWDIGYHVDHGRDEGVLTIPHLLIVAGLQGFVLAGLLHGVLRRGPAVPGEVRIDRLRMRLAPGGVVLLVCGAIALLGFPLDALWHALFGEDVTLWGPTHLFMIGGASLGTLGLWMLLREGMAQGRPDVRVRRGNVRAAGGVLIGLSTFQAEFDFGVPQFQLLYQPVLVALAAGLGLVLARSLLGRWGAVKALGMYLAVRGALALFVGVAAGFTTPHFPLYVVEALIVEAAALAAAGSRLRFALLAGGGIGTIALAAEWAWSHIWMPHPWPASLLPEAVPLALAAAVGGALLGVRIAQALDAPRPGTAAMALAPLRRAPVVLAGVLVLAALAVPLPRSGGDGTRASIVPTPAGHDAVGLRVTLSPRDAAAGAQWFEVLSWQGRDRGTRRITALRSLGGGRYEAEHPVPVGGNWKTMVRLAKGSHLMGLPVFLPPSAQSGRPAVPAVPRAATLTSDTGLLQREATGGAPWLVTLAYAALGLIVAVWIALLAWALSAGERGAGGTVRGAWRQRSVPA